MMYDRKSRSPIGESPARNALTSRPYRGSVPSTRLPPPAARPGDCGCRIPYSRQYVARPAPRGEARRPPRRRRRRRKPPESLGPSPSPPAPISSGALSVPRASYLIAASTSRPPPPVPRPAADKTQCQTETGPPRR